MSGGLRGKKTIYYVYKSGFVFSSTRVSHQICQPQPCIWSGIVSWSPSAIAVCSMKLALFSFISSVTSFLPLVLLCCWWGVLEQALLNEVVMLFSSYSPLSSPSCSQCTIVTTTSLMNIYYTDLWNTCFWLVGFCGQIFVAKWLLNCAFSCLSCTFTVFFPSHPKITSTSISIFISGIM